MIAIRHKTNKKKKKNRIIDSFRNETPSCCSETQNSAVAVFRVIFVGETEQKQEIWCLKRKSLNVNFLFIELL